MLVVGHSCLGRVKDLRQVLSYLIGRVGPSELLQILLDWLVVLGSRECLFETFEVLWHHDGLEQTALARLTVALVLQLASRSIPQHCGQSK